jgi:hypothetical protein
VCVMCSHLADTCTLAGYLLHTFLLPVNHRHITLTVLNTLELRSHEEGVSTHCKSGANCDVWTARCRNIQGCLHVPKRPSSLCTFCTHGAFAMGSFICIPSRCALASCQVFLHSCAPKGTTTAHFPPVCHDMSNLVGEIALTPFCVLLRL